MAGYSTLQSCWC